MPTQLATPFLQKKISEIPQALFHGFCNSLLQMPVHIVRPLFVDEFSQVWLTVPSPVQRMLEFEREFPSQLDFYQKGKDFYMKVAGQAIIVTDPEELNALPIADQLKAEVNKRQIMLLKVRVKSANYFDRRGPKQKNWMLRLKEAVVGFFTQDPHHELQTA